MLFVPFTTLLYVVLWTPGLGLTELDWIWLAIALFIDLGGFGSTGYVNRGRLPRYRRV